MGKSSEIQRRPDVGYSKCFPLSSKYFRTRMRADFCCQAGSRQGSIEVSDVIYRGDGSDRDIYSWNDFF